MFCLSCSGNVLPQSVYKSLLIKPQRTLFISKGEVFFSIKLNVNHLVPDATLSTLVVLRNELFLAGRGARVLELSLPGSGRCHSECPTVAHTDKLSNINPEVSELWPTGQIQLTTKMVLHF